ncbi:MAG: tRNA pseudouridine(13) synthase TruD [Woeseiaceae bacterium]|nr:tRNA pseudouridine(13) synthase TruD [Woeseiaceae bacterium]
MPALPDWARAHGTPACSGAIRSSAADFIVEETLGFEPSDDGEHDFLKLEKTDTNTDWLARQLARHAGIPARDVGFAGLKDRRAVTTQWFSVRRPSGGTDWQTFALDGVRILDIRRNARKLRRGAHSGNRFRIAIRGNVGAEGAAIDARVAAIATRGVPNYFGEQRFGRDAGNLSLALDVLGGKRVRRHERSLALSTARSYLFNSILDARVREGSWDRLVKGDRANLDGSASVFAVDELSSELELRAAAGDLHPTATLWGEGAPLSTFDAAALEVDVVGKDDGYTANFAAGLVAARFEAASRPLRLPVREIGTELAEDCLSIGFWLPRGAFATSVLRELVSYR